jgi:hypothetical protein
MGVAMWEEQHERCSIGAMTRKLQHGRNDIKRVAMQEEQYYERNINTRKIAAQEERQCVRNNTRRIA